MLYILYRYTKRHILLTAYNQGSADRVNSVKPTDFWNIWKAVEIQNI